MTVPTREELEMRIGEAFFAEHGINLYTALMSLIVRADTSLPKTSHERLVCAMERGRIDPLRKTLPEQPQMDEITNLMRNLFESGHLQFFSQENGSTTKAPNGARTRG